MHVSKKFERWALKPAANGLNARTCEWCGSQKPGAQPLRLDGKRGYWHINCFELARRSVSKMPRDKCATGNKP